MDGNERINVFSVPQYHEQSSKPWFQLHIMMLALIIFTGFVVPIDYMLGWCRWISYVNPVAWGYESLMVNEFHGRNFLCSAYIPDYVNATDDQYGL